jgi:hypothetical protein
LNLAAEVFAVLSRTPRGDDADGVISLRDVTTRYQTR